MCRPALLACLTALAVGCDHPEVMRRVELGPQAELPSLRCLVIGDAMRLEASGLQPLAGSARYVAWVETRKESVALGELGAGALVAAWDGLGVALDEVTWVVVTEEAAGAALPEAPSAVVVLRGPVGGAGGFAPFGPAALAAARAEAVAQDGQVQVMASGLPVLPPGLAYGVWARRAAAGGGDGAPAPPAGEGELLELGRLERGSRLAASADLGRLRRMVVTVQSERGAAGISPVTVLGGLLVLPEAEQEAEVHTH